MFISSFASESHRKQFIVGAVLLSGAIIFGFYFESMVLFQFWIGILFGFALNKGYIGFAGMSNRPYRVGSYRLIKIILWAIFAAGVFSAAIFMGTDIATYKLSIKPINSGLLIGALLFGFGMALASACASGVLQDLAINPLSPFIVFVFFCVGVCIGFYPQSHWAMIKVSWFHTATSSKGVFLPDLFGGQTMHGYMGAILLSAVITGGITMYVNHLQKKTKDKGVLPCIIDTEKERENLSERRRGKGVFERFFILPWGMWESATLLVATATMLFLGAHKGWGVTTEFGLLAGRVVHFFGVPVADLVQYTGKGAESFTRALWQDGPQVRNFGLVVGAFISALMMGGFSGKANISVKKFFFLALAGFVMGIGTRFANGCNVGGFYTPLSHFSPSGWVFFVFMLLGGYMGNKVKKSAHF